MKAAPLPADAILRYLADHGPVDTVTVAAELGVSRQLAFHRLRNSELAGHVVRVDRAPAGLNGRPSVCWRMADAPTADVPTADVPERDTAPMVQRYVDAGAWQRAAPGPAARWFDGLVS